MTIGRQHTLGVIVVGGGQAGLAVGYFLRRQVCCANAAAIAAA